MPIQEGIRYAGLAARMLEIVSTNTPWHRRLWRGGTLLLADELLADSIRHGTPDQALKDQRSYVTDAFRADRGVPSSQCITICHVISEIKPGLTTSSHAWISFREHIARARAEYLTTWAAVLDGPPDPQRPVDTEGAARRSAAHLLDAGMHKNSLYSWLRAIQDDPTHHTVGDFLREAHKRITTPYRVYQFCIPLENQQTFGSAGRPPEWLNSREASQWKRNHAPTAAAVRHQGAFLLTVDARDINAAADHARTNISNLVTKFELASGQHLNVSSVMWSKDRGTAFPTRATNRLISIKSFGRQNSLHDLTTPDYITNTLALIQRLRTGAPHIAVISGWSAIESLLVGPDDGGDVVAAGRFALIVAASMVRAEFNALALRYAKHHGDRLADQINAVTDSRTRAHLFQGHAVSTAAITFPDVVDDLALQRIRPMLTNPRREMEKIVTILTREFTRLYRKRNMVVHNGQIHDTNLHAVSDTVTPLIGAGIDRIISVGLKREIRPIELSAMAQARLHYLTPANIGGSDGVLDLLELA